MFRQLLFLMLLVSYVIVDSAITKINFDRKGIIKMSGAIPYLAKQAQKQILKKAITSTTGLDDFLGIKPLNENEDIVMNEYNRPNSPSQKMFRHGVSRIIMRLLILMDFHKIICYKICVMNI